MEKPQDFAARLAVALTHKGISSKDLAAKIGLSWQALRKYEAGSSKEMYATNLFAAAKALSVNALWLATGEGPMTGGPILASFAQMLSAPALEVAVMLDSIGDPEAKRVAYMEMQQVLVMRGAPAAAPPAPVDPPKLVRLPRPGKPPGKSPGEP